VATSVLPDFAAMGVDDDLLGDVLGEPTAVGESVEGAGQRRLGTYMVVPGPVRNCNFVTTMH
jgi:hypothetical protein